ncbi:MAG: nuclear transport factor 2 family protein [Candidatus Binatia bacterium]|nr:nuclear transport factor 2 family protein [Candidatus Binatia bacterium]
MKPLPLQRWHTGVEARSLAEIEELLEDEAVFFSPIVFTPQRGRELVKLYLAGAMQVIANENFRYVKEIVGPHSAVLEFETTIDGVYVNGVDILTWDDAGKLVEIKVMLRPLKAIQLVHERMAAMLAALQSDSAQCQAR